MSAAAAEGAQRAVALGLTVDEYELILARIGREPTEVELAMFSLLVVGALLLQALQAAAANAADGGPAAGARAG